MAGLYDSNKDVLFCVVFLQTGAPRPLHSREPTRSQNKLVYVCIHKHHMCMHTVSLSLSLSHTHTHRHRVRRIAWRGEISRLIWKMWVFDDLTLHGRLFQTDTCCSKRVNVCTCSEGRQRMAVVGGLYITHGLSYQAVVRGRHNLWFCYQAVVGGLHLTCCFCYQAVVRGLHITCSRATHNPWFLLPGSG